jgi:hypothetical protein
LLDATGDMVQRSGQAVNRCAAAPSEVPSGLDRLSGLGHDRVPRSSVSPPGCDGEGPSLA